MSAEPTPTGMPSAHGDGLYAVILAMAASDDVGAASTELANSDIATAEFMKRIYQLLAQFKGNMKGIEDFLKRYVANHQEGSAREHMSTGSLLSLDKLSNMADKIGDFESKLKATQDKIDDLNKKLDGCNDQLIQLCEDNGMSYSVTMNAGKRIVTPDFSLGQVYSHWLTYSLERGGFLCPMAAAAFALEKMTAFSEDFGNLETTMGSYGVDLGNAVQELANIQSSETDLVSGTTGSMNSRADGLSEPARAIIQTAQQAAAMSFLFLEALNNKGSQN